MGGEETENRRIVRVVQNLVSQTCARTSADMNTARIRRRRQLVVYCFLILVCSTTVVTYVIYSIGFSSARFRQHLQYINPALLYARPTRHNNVNQERHGAFEDVNGTRLVVVMAYMHTGSSYVGSVLQHHKGSFYWYEPLRSLKDDSVLDETVMFFNGTTRHLSGTFVDADIGAENAANILTCKHDKLDITTLTRDYFRAQNDNVRDTMAFFGCQGRPKWLARPVAKAKNAREKQTYFTAKSKNKIVQCLPKLVDKCEAANARILKCIHMTMKAAEIVLRRVPSLRIIYLVRDPRAMLDSQLRKGDNGVGYMPAFVRETQSMCDRMLEDIQLSHDVMLAYPGRLMRVRYEEIAEAPVESARSMYRFAGIPFDEKDEAFVQRLSIDAAHNATDRETKWRDHVDQAHLDVINTHCERLFRELGYVMYDRVGDIRRRANSTYAKHKPFSFSVDGF